MRTRTAGGNSTNRFHLTLGPVGVDNGNHNLLAYDPDGMPALLAMACPFYEREAIRIVQDELAGLESELMILRLLSFFAVSHSNVTIL